MARETDYTILYRAAADFSNLTREAAKAKAILKAMREEEEKANRTAIQDADKRVKAYVRARQALEQQNMAHTVSARLSHEMAQRAKGQADSVRELAKGSEAAARQINKLAEAYKKLNSAEAGEGSSSSSSSASRSVNRAGFAGVTIADLQKAQQGLAGYLREARQATDVNTKLATSQNKVKQATAQATDILARLSSAQKSAAQGTTIITQETKKLGDVVETTTKRVTNAGTEAEKVVTTIRRVTKELDNSGKGFANWAGNVVGNMRRAWREADNGVSTFSKLKGAMASSGGGDGPFKRIATSIDHLGDSAKNAIGFLARLPRVIQLAIGIAAIFEPAVAVLGSLSAVALGAGNNLAFLAGSLAAIPGLIAAGATAFGALFIAVKPVIGIFQQYGKAQQEITDNAGKAAPKQRDNTDAIRSAARGVRTAMESLADAQRSEKRAQEDLSQAWRDAKKDLQDLRDEVSRGSLDEESAVLRLARAREEQAKTNADVKSSILDRREAALAVKEAEADLADVRKRNKENQQELAEAEKQGVAGSERVVRAQENLVNAHRGVTNASLNLADAKQNLASASKVEATAAAQTMTQQNRYKQLLDQTGPQTRKFVEHVVSMGEAWKKVKRETGESFFKHIAGDTKQMNSLLPIASNLLNTAADSLGRVAHRGLEMITSGPWKKDFKQLAKDNAVNIENMGDAGLSLADAFRHITMAAAPFTKWVTGALKEGAANFAAWAKKSREDKSIQRFLDETKERLQQMWQITKNVLATLKSWGSASNDFGKWMLDRVEAMTKKWRDNAKAQEENGSSLKKYLEDIKPVLTAVGSLVGAVAAGFAGIAADPENIQGTVKLLTSLEKDVLPPLLRFLNELNDSGIALTVAHALGSIFTAFANFLESGGGGAISQFVKSFAAVVELFAEFASLPVIGPLLGGIAWGLALVAGAMVGAKFVGLFKLFELFKWFANTGKTVVNRFKEVGDAAAEAGAKVNAVNTVTTTTTTTGGGGSGGGRPSGGITGPIGVATSFAPISDGELSKVRKNLEDFGPAAEKAATKTGFFKRALDGAKSAAGGMKSGLSSAMDFLGGPWGAALAIATGAIIFATSEYEKHKQRIQETKDAYQGLADAYEPLKEGNAEQIRGLIEQNERFGSVLESLKYFGINAVQVSSALKGNKQDLDAVNGAIDDRIEVLEEEIRTGKKSRGENGLLIGTLVSMKKEINDSAVKQAEFNRIMAESGTSSRTWKERLGGMTQAQVEGAQQSTVYAEKIATLSGYLDTMASSTSTATERANGMKAAIDAIYGAETIANESSEAWNRSLLNFIEISHRKHASLSETTAQGLDTRDALEAAAKATRDETIALIASGTPYADAIKKHDDRIKKLKEEADKAGLNKTETEKLIAMYGTVPGNVETNIAMSGYEKAYEDLKNLKIAQLAIEQGIPVDQAAKEYNKQRAKVPSKGDYTGAGGLATGGPVWGEGTKTSDSIPAWLSNGEFVQKADSVDYYGHNLMHALNNRAIKREVLETAATLSRGVQHDPKLDPMYAAGGAVRLANGGFAQRDTMPQVDHIKQPSAVWPFLVGTQGMIEASKKLFEKWKKDHAGSLGGGSVTASGLRTGILGILGDLRGHFGSVPLISGLRKGATTLSGNRSYHALGRAIDLAPVRAWAEYLRSTFGSQLKELITPWRDINMLNGRPHRYSRPIEAQHGVFGQNAHIHAAYAKGGLVNPLDNMFNLGGLAVPSTSGAPATNASSLSQAARSVVSTHNSGLTIGDITIHNPMQEPGGESIRRSILRTAMLFDGP